MQNTEQKGDKRIVILSTAYFAPLQYFAELLSGDADIFIERHENYSRQSYRNRCTIYAANGLLDLSVPVAKRDKSNKLITEVKISYDTPWQKQHFKAIESAYRRSPFYEYYIDDLMPFFKCRHTYLYDFNMQILSTVCSLMKVSFCVQETETYSKYEDKKITDLRNVIHPAASKQNKYFAPHYSQVFAEKWGFKPNLSILDLLLNTGMEAKFLLNSKLN